MFWKGGQKDSKSQRARCQLHDCRLKGQRSSSHDALTLSLPKQDLNNDNTNTHVNVKGETVIMLHAQEKNYGQLTIVEGGRISLPKGGAP